MFRIVLKSLRENAGYSQAAFARKIGVAQSTVGNWESGSREPNIETLNKLSDFFGVSVDYLLGRDNPPEKKEKPSTLTDEELSAIIEIVSGLSPENRNKLYELAEMYFEKQGGEKQ